MGLGVETRGACREIDTPDSSNLEWRAAASALEGTTFWQEGKQVPGAPAIRLLYLMPTQRTHTHEGGLRILLPRSSPQPTPISSARCSDFLLLPGEQRRASSSNWAMFGKAEFVANFAPQQGASACVFVCGCGVFFRLCLPPDESEFVACLLLLFLAR